MLILHHRFSPHHLLRLVVSLTDTSEESDEDLNLDDILDALEEHTTASHSSASDFDDVAANLEAELMLDQ